MIAAWMLYSLAIGMLLAVGALAAERFCRLLRLPRRWVWLAALTAAVVLSGSALREFRQPVRATPSIPYSPSLASPAAAADAGLLGRVLKSVAEVRTAAGAVLERGYRSTASRAERAAGSPALLGAWGLISAAALLLLGLTLLRLYRARRGWRRHRIGDVPVLLAPDFGPAVVGVVRPAIVVPAWLLREPAEAQRVIVAHEEEHRRAHDPAVLAAACVAVCLLPWNLALWWVLSRLRLAVELDCDDRILRRGVTPLSYGSLLLEIASRTAPRLFGATALADSRSHLERRLLAMSEKNRLPGLARPLLAGTAALVLAAAACGTDVPTAAEIRDLDAAAARQQAEQSGLLTGAKAPLYVLDGKVVTEAEARAVAPAEIAEIRVLKDAAARTAYGEAGEKGVILMKRRSGELAEVSAARQPLREGEFRVMADKIVIDSAVAVTGYGGAELAEKRARQAVDVREMTGEALAATRADTAVAASAVPAKGVLLRKTRAGAAAGEKAVVARGAEADQQPMRKTSPVIVVDGVRAEASTTLPLRSEDIESVEVFKGEAAIARFGPAAANGAVVITTKKGTKK